MSWPCPPACARAPRCARPPRPMERRPSNRRPRCSRRARRVAARSLSRPSARVLGSRASSGSRPALARGSGRGSRGRRARHIVEDPLVPLDLVLRSRITSGNAAGATVTRGNRARRGRADRRETTARRTASHPARARRRGGTRAFASEAPCEVGDARRASTMGTAPAAVRLPDVPARAGREAWLAALESGDDLFDVRFKSGGEVDAFEGRVHGRHVRGGAAHRRRCRC